MTAMTYEDAENFVANTFDDDSPTPEKLHEVFAALYGRSPNAQDEEDGIWSLICAAGNHCPCSTRREHYTTRITVWCIEKGTPADYIVEDEEGVSSITHVRGPLAPEGVLEEVLHDWSHECDLKGLAAELLGAWLATYDGDPTGLTVEVAQCDRSVTRVA